MGVLGVAPVQSNRCPQTPASRESEWGPVRRSRPTHLRSLSLAARLRLAVSGARSGEAGPPTYARFARCAPSACGQWGPVRRSRPTHLRSLRSLRAFGLRSVGPGPAKPAHPPTLASLAARLRLAVSGARSGEAGPPTYARFARCAPSACGQWGPVRRSRPTHLRSLRSLRAFGLRSVGPGPAKPAHPSTLPSVAARLRLAVSGARSGEAGPPVFAPFGRCAPSACGQRVPVRRSRPTRLRSLRSLRAFALRSAGPGPAKPAHPSSLPSLAARLRLAVSGARSGEAGPPVYAPSVAARLRLAVSGARSGEAGPPVFAPFGRCAASPCGQWVPVRRSRPTHLRSLRSLRAFGLRSVGPGPAKPAHPPTLASLAARLRLAVSGARSGEAGPPTYARFARCAPSACGGLVCGSGGFCVARCDRQGRQAWPCLRLARAFGRGCSVVLFSEPKANEAGWSGSAGPGPMQAEGAQ